MGKRRSRPRAPPVVCACRRPACLGYGPLDVIASPYGSGGSSRDRLKEPFESAPFESAPFESEAEMEPVIESPETVPSKTPWRGCSKCTLLPATRRPLRGEEAPSSSSLPLQIPS